jgi:hypothetical protein
MTGRAFAVVVAAASLGLLAQPARAAAQPDTTFQDVGAALQAHGIMACETDWATRSPTQDGSAYLPSGRKEFPEERDRRSRLVVLAPQPCPPLDETGDVSGDDADKVALLEVREFKSRTAGASLKKHGKDYTGTTGVGYVYQGTTLITLNALEPPGMAAAFTAAMKDLHARRRWVGELWRQAHPPVS